LNSQLKSYYETYVARAKGRDFQVVKRGDGLYLVGIMLLEDAESIFDDSQDVPLVWTEE
jgi:hypothetical protein